MADYNNFYRTSGFEPNTFYAEQLFQLLRIVADGDLIDKSSRDKLVADGYAQKVNGFNIITAEGIRRLMEIGYIAP